ncbi:MAG: Holliday junction branch migration protein RuvA [Alphaproteobacteria bacterium]
MIARLHGTLISSDTESAVIDVGGVGYLVFCSARTLRTLPADGGAATVVVETHVREDHIHLYGFTTENERAWFRTLLSVQGVGARMALAVLSTLSPDELSMAIAADDKAVLRRAPGVGPKVAGRIAAELKDKAAGLAIGPITLAASSNQAAAIDESSVTTGEAVSALVNLGYGRSEAFSAVAAAVGDASANGDVAALIRAGLKELSAQ